MTRVRVHALVRAALLAPPAPLALTLSLCPTAQALLAALAACAPSRAAAAAPYCALYGTCRPAGGDAFTPRSVNCANAPGAVPPATPDFNLTACPEYQGAACCNEAQVRRRRARYAREGRRSALRAALCRLRADAAAGAQHAALRDNLGHAALLFGRCPACAEDFRRLWCAFTCSPQQVRRVASRGICCARRLRLT